MATAVVAVILLATWLVAGAATARRPARRPLGALVLAATTAIAVLLAIPAARPGAPVGIASLAAVVVLALPDGRLRSRGRRVGAALTLAAGGALVATALLTELGAELGAAGAVIAFGATLPFAHRRYRTSVASDRTRFQWLALAAVLSGSTSIVLTAASLLVGWPERVGTPAAATTVLVPLALALIAGRRLRAGVERALLVVVPTAGLAIGVVAVYLVVVVGLGRVPTRDERTVLALSMVAAAVAALLAGPTRQRLADAARVLIRGDRRPPDEVLDMVSERMGRALPPGELLLQVVEAARLTFDLSQAQAWSVEGDTLRLEAAVPHRATRTVRLDATERDVIARGGVTGAGRAAVWLPAILEAGTEETADVAAGALRVVPAVHAGTLLGLLVLRRPSTAEPFDDADDRVLAELGRRVAVAVHNRQLDDALRASLVEVRRQADELRASRTRIVAAADAERRRIERDLHDGAQQRLVALAVGLRLAHDAAASGSVEPDDAAAMLDDLAGEVKATIAELRELAHGIYPLALIDGGLAPALRAATSRHPSPATVHVGDDLPRLTAELEAAVYFCCLEALQNAAKHAPGATVTITLAIGEPPEGGGLGSKGTVGPAEEVLRFSVTDDGPGIAPASGPLTELLPTSHGFVNMTDRLGAVGGAVEWQSPPTGGVTVSGWCPATRRAAPPS